MELLNMRVKCVERRGCTRRHFKRNKMREQNLVEGVVNQPDLAEC